MAANEPTDKQGTPEAQDVPQDPQEAQDLLQDAPGELLDEAAKEAADEALQDADQVQAELDAALSGALEAESDEDFNRSMEAIDKAEQAMGKFYASGKVSRGEVTETARQNIEASLGMVDLAIKADDKAFALSKLTSIATENRNRAAAKEARHQARAARKDAKVKHKAATKSAKNAYNTIKYSAPNKMGFMRVMMVIYAIHIVLYLLFLLLENRDSMTYGTATAVDWILILLEAVAFWLFVNRYKEARHWVIGMSVLNLAVIFFTALTSTEHGFETYLIPASFYVLLICYFAFSKRVKYALINDLSIDRWNKVGEDFKIERRGWPFVRNLIIYFIVFSVLGHWMEMAMCQLIIAGVVQGEYDPTNTMLWRDWLYPFPMEGAAVVIIALVLYPLFEWLKNNMKSRIAPYVISFVANALVCSIIEFSMGLLVNADLQLWDYTNNFGNIMGQVCLQNTMAFGVAASLIAWFVYPLLERLIARVPRDVMNIVFILVVVFGAIIWSLYLVNVSI